MIEIIDGFQRTDGKRIVEIRVGERLAQPNEAGEYLGSVEPETCLAKLGYVGGYIWETTRIHVRRFGELNGVNTDRQLGEMSDQYQTKLLEVAWLSGDRELREDILRKRRIYI